MYNNTETFYPGDKIIDSEAAYDELNADGTFAQCIHLYNKKTVKTFPEGKNKGNYYMKHPYATPHSE